MRPSHLFRPRFLALLAGALIFAAVSYGFAAGNTLPGSRAGDGTGAITNYTLDTTTPPNSTTSLHVSLETNGDPTKISEGALYDQRQWWRVDPSDGESGLPHRRRQLRSAVGTVRAPTSAALTWECVPGGTPAYVQAGIQLRVIAAQ